MTEERSIAEIIWTSEPCCNVKEGNGHCPDDCKVWTSPDGSRWEYGSTPDVELTPDDMLTWLRGRGWGATLESAAVELEFDEPVFVSVWRHTNGMNYKWEAPTLHAALEAACWAVAEVLER